MTVIIRDIASFVSVAAFIAIIRMICSLTTASLNAWNSTVFAMRGRRSSRSSSIEGSKS